MVKYIYEYPNWPVFEWDESKIQLVLGQVRHQQGRVLGQMSSLGFKVKEEALKIFLRGIYKAANN